MSTASESSPPGPVTPSPFAATALRTDYCGELSLADEGRSVVLCGWVNARREHGEHLAFVDVRDRTGVVQCVVDGAADLRSEYVVRIAGTVAARSAETVNPKLATGQVELKDCEVEVLAPAEPPPFPVERHTEVDEGLRLKHRYLDLRSEHTQRNLATRARVNAAVRRAMERQGFLEVETPLLIASTPEGARDFIVPSRLAPGHVYALPQSPQLFKQLCMVGGLDRYYQIARCLRDEDLRADRQFEFTQLDLEASFVSQQDILDAVSEAVADATEAVTGERPGPIAQMPWHQAMERFGSDKPDVRFAMELTELTEVFEATAFKAFQAPCVKGIRVPGGSSMTRNQLDNLTDTAKRLGAKGLVWMKVQDDRSLTSPVVKFLSEPEQTALVQAMEAGPGDLVLIVADERPRVWSVLGRLRLELGRPSVGEGGLRFLWVVDFPLFEGLDDAGQPIPAHHPFTMPHAEDLDRLSSGDPEQLLAVRSQAYDLVLNGWELGSGSVRIHRADVQARIFDLLGIGPEEVKAKFGFLLEAFRYGAPPHAGFAVGLDRLVALLAGEDNIREVIAFPKTQSGADPLTGAPTPADPAHLEELGLRSLPTKA